MASRVTMPQASRELLAQWYSEEFLVSTLVFRGSFLGRIFGLFRQTAVTINKTVHLTSRAHDLESLAGITLLGHEYYHVLQQQEMGWWKFLARYVWRWRPTHVRRGRTHPLEVPAYERSDSIYFTLRDLMP